MEYKVTGKENLFFLFSVCFGWKWFLENFSREGKKKKKNPFEVSFMEIDVFFVNCGENDMMHLKFTLYEFSDIELQQPCKSLVLFYCELWRKWYDAP